MQQQPQQPLQNGMYQGSNFTNGFGNGVQQQAPQPMAPQLTGYYGQQAQPMQFQQTGMPQNSFGSVAPPLAPLPQAENTELKIPNVRISFITLEDQQKFEHLFRASVPKGENAIDGNTAREILMKSNIPASQLAEIWALADTTKSGKLLFPEFALALHLCNVVLRGENLPFELPTAMKQEVTNFVDSINFYVPEEESNTSSQPSNIPNFSSNSVQPQQTGLNAMPPQQTGFTAPNLQPQPTGYPAPTLQPQPTGFAAPALQPQQTGFAPSALQPQATGFNTQPGLQSGFSAPQPGSFLQPQATGFNAPAAAPALQPQATGFNGTALQPQATGFNPVAPLQQQPTGINGTSFMTGNTAGAPLAPQQTGFTSVLTNQTGIMPQATGFSNSTLPPMPTGPLVPQKTGGLTNFFNTVSEAPVRRSAEWAITQQERSTFEKIFKNISQQGFIGGPQAIQVLSKSGLARPDLEKIWNLSDINNRGRLNKDEFSVAMHLIYRRLSGMDVPDFLPEELVPPSTRVLDDVKTSLKSQNNFGKKTSRLNSSVSNNFRNDDNDSGIYVSRNRRKSGSTSEKVSDDSSDLTQEENVARLKKLIQERKIILNAIDARDEDLSNDSYAKQKQKNEIETLKIKIKDAHTKLTQSSSGTSSVQKQELLTRLRAATDKLPSLMSQLVSVDNQIKDAKIDLFKVKLQKESPSIKFYASEEEKSRAKSRFLMKQRMALLTGKPAPTMESFEDGETQLEAEKEKIDKETQTQISTMREIETSIRSIADGVSSQLESSNSDQVDYEKYEKGYGISSSDVRLFIDMLKAIKPVAAAPSQPIPSQTPPTTYTPEPSRSTSNSVSSPTQATGVDRAAYIKQQAQERMNARLAKLGIRRGQPTSALPPTEGPSSPALSKVSSPLTPKKQAQPPPPPVLRHTNTFNSTPAALPPAVLPVVTEKVEAQPEEEDDEDKELAELLAQKAKLEEAEKEKQKKRAERKAEIARLKAEMQALKEKGDDSDEEDKPEESKEKAAPITPMAPTVPQTNGDLSVPQPATIQPSATHTNNPFFKPGTSEPISQLSTPAIQKGNPFFKPDPSRTSSTSSLNQVFDKNAAEAQRRAQRGQSNGDDDDDWGEENSSEEDEEDAIPLRGPAHLASLLFGGGSVPPPAPQVSTPPTETVPVPVPVPALDPVPVAPVQEAQPASTVDTENNTDLDETFATPPSTAIATPVPGLSMSTMAPPIPLAPPLPTENGFATAEVSETPDAPPLPSAEVPSIPPIPNGAHAAYSPPLEADDIAAPPPLPETGAPVPPPLPDTGAPAPPPLPDMSAPPPPPLPDMGAPPPPPLPNMGAPPPPPLPQGGAPLAPPIAAGGISALLGEIQGGRLLKKVAEQDKHIASGATVGRVL